ncbi:MAG: lytic transglycosylase domain-containing protein [Methylobacterium sp.]|nr:lytic transglycosylase domain-containing protein [Methylobacterium sp.]MCA3675528.1 lytic transglycosylase domain-containing protein [Methylobacterium sp.]MCA3682287.1 lytic transglycosylase domain-containing protein [Methylobacterium sp.]
MSGAPVYISRGSSQGIGELQPSRADMSVSGQAQARFGQALGGLGNSIFSLSQQIEEINRSSTLADRKTQFLTGIDDLGKQFENDPDPATAEQRFQEQVMKLEGSTLEGLRPDDEAELRVQLRRQSISYAGGVRAGALKKQADGYQANVDQQFDVHTKRYAQAQSETERQAIVGELDETLKSGVQRGMMTAKAAEAYRQSMVQTGDNALVLRQIGMNPAAAQAALADPEQYKGLNPVQREQFAQQARAAAEAQRAQRLEIRARTNPEAATMEAGRVSGPGAIARIFDSAIIPQESGGRAGAVSPAGAVGIGQLMPDTALGVATKHASKDPAFAEFARLPESERRERLLTDPALNRRLGMQYLQDTIEATDGSVVAGIAGYHAGTGRAIEWHKAAVAKYGEGYSAAEFLTVMDQNLHDGKGGQQGKRTVDYVRDIYKRMGVDISAPAFTGMNTFRASDIVQREWDRREAQTNQIVNEVTSLSRQQADQFGGLLDQGLNVNPARLAEIQSGLQLGAARGNAQAAETLRLLNERIEMLPHVQRAYRMAPAELEAYTSNLRSAFAQDPTPQKERQLKVFEAVAAQVAKGAKEAPVQLYERQTEGQPTFVNPQAQIGSAELAQQLQARSIVSDGAFKRYQTRAFFKPEEARAWKDRFETMGDQEKFDLLETLHRNTGGKDAFRAAVAEVTGGDKLPATAGMFMTNNPQLARDILRGSAIAQLDGIKPKAEDVKTALKATMPGLLYPPQIQSQLIEAALAVYASERGRNAALYDASDRAGLEAAIERVTGKVSRINGSPVPVPRSMATFQFEAMFGRSGVLNDEGLASQGGAKAENGQKLDAAFIRRYATLVPADDRIGDHQRYRVVINQGGQQKGVLRGDGQGYLYFNMPELFKTQRMQYGNSAASQEGMFVRDRRTGYLPYPEPAP